MDDESLDSFSETDLIDDTSINTKKVIDKPYRNRSYRPGKISHEETVDFDEIDKALQILTAPIDNRNRKQVCYGNLDDHNHKRIMHYNELIKRSIFKAKWKSLNKLLSEYISVKKNEVQHKKIITQYFMLYLLNDPVALKNESWKNFFQARLLCKSENEMKLILEKMMTVLDKDIPNNDFKTKYKS